MPLFRLLHFVYFARSFLVLTTLLCVGVQSSVAHAQPEALLRDHYATVLRPFYEAPSLAGDLAVPRAHLSYRAWIHPDARGALLLMTGRNESHTKYIETIFDLYQQGYSVFIYDHRGQGHSSRLLTNGQIGHVEKFDDYINDLRQFVDQVFLPYTRADQIRVALAHSLGGAILARFLETHRGAQPFQKAVLLTPMIQIRLFGFESPALQVARTLDFMGFGKHFVPFGKPYRPLLTYDRSDRSSSATRLALAESEVIARPQLSLGAPSNHWVVEAIEATQKIRRDARKVWVPLLVVTAGKDSSVDSFAAREFCANAKVCRTLNLPKAHHELWIESDAQREAALKATLQFLQ